MVSFDEDKEELTGQQVYLGDTGGLAPDDPRKAVITMKRITGRVRFPSLYKSYIHPTLESVECAIAVCPTSARWR